MAMARATVEQTDEAMMEMSGDWPDITIYFSCPRGGPNGELSRDILCRKLVSYIKLHGDNLSDLHIYMHPPTPDTERATITITLVDGDGGLPGKTIQERGEDLSEWTPHP